MRFLKNLFSVVALILVGYSHIVVLDELGLEAEQVRQKTPKPVATPRTYVSVKTVATWYEVSPDGYPIQNELRSIIKSDKQTFRWIRGGEYVDSNSSDEYATEQELSFEEGNALLEDAEFAIGFMSGPEYSEE